MRARASRGAGIVSVLAVTILAVVLGAVVAATWPSEDDTGAGRDTTPVRAATTHGFASPNAAVAPRYTQPTGPAPRTSGPLTSADVPAPALLGQGFRRYVDPGGAEVGWIGNGTFVRGRDAHEAAFGVLPLGCRHRLEVGLPVPRHALQGSYHGPGARPAQVVVLDFASQAAAADYFDGFTAMLTACRAPDGPAGLVVHVTTRAATSYIGTRTYLPTQVWSEVDVRAGRRVAVLLSSVRIAQGRALAIDLRRAVAGR